MITDTDRINWIEEAKPRIRDIYLMDQAKMGFSINLELWNGMVPYGDEDEFYLDGLTLREVIDKGIEKSREFWSRQPDYLRPEKYHDQESH